MAIIVFGGDRLGNINIFLEKNGYQVIKHVKGRAKGDLKFDIPCEAEGVLLFTDFLSHNLARSVKESAKKRGLKVYCARRSWSHICQLLPIPGQG